MNESVKLKTASFEFVIFQTNFFFSKYRNIIQ